MIVQRQAAPTLGAADEYLTLAQLAAYSKLSVRSLRKFLALPPSLALPAYRPGRRVLVRQSEFDAWFLQYRRRGKPVIARVLHELGLDPERLADTRTPSARAPRHRRAAKLSAP